MDIVRLTCLQNMTVTTLLANSRVAALDREGEDTFFAQAYSEHVVRTRASLTVVDAFHHPLWINRREDVDGMRSYFGKPVLWPGGHVFGTIEFLNGEPMMHHARTHRLVDQLHHLLEADIAYGMRELRRADAEHRLMVEHERLALSASAGRFGVWDYNILENELCCDGSWHRIIGLDPARPVRTIEDFRPHIHPDDVAHATRVDKVDLASLLANDKDYTNTFRIVRPDGEIRWLISAACLIEEGGLPARAVGVVTDVTEQRLEEQGLRSQLSVLQKTSADLAEVRSAAEAAKHARSELLATVSHEMRTPLTGIVGVLHLLERETLSQAGRDLLREAQACGDMLRRLLNDVLDLSRIEAGKLEIVSEPVSISDVTTSVMRVLGSQTHAKKIYLRPELDPDLGWVMSDPVRLRQCLFNLIGNAVKFTNEGGIRVRISRSGPSRCRVEVHDTGIGVPVGDQGRLFQRFGQRQSAAGRAAGGAGLGLAIVKQVAEMMGGAVGFSSQESVGSIFWFEFEAPSIDAPADRSPNTPFSIEHMHILVVDDNEHGLSIATKLLEALGAKVLAVTNGYDAINAVRNMPFEVILMDMEMSGIDGLETSRRIRALPDLEQAATAIVALTGRELDRQVYADAGLDGVLIKPFQPVGLVSLIGEVLGRGAERANNRH